MKIAPKQAGIYLDEKLEEKTDFFFGSVLIENLLPKKYKIEVKKTGYFTWEKTLEVREKEVTEAKNVVLFPENPNFNILSGGIEKFWFSPDQRKIVWMEVLDKTGWSLKLYDLDRNVKSQLINGNNIYKNGADLISLKFSEISKEISLEVGVAEEIKHFSLLIDRTPPFLTEIQESAATTSENILVSEKINNDLYYLSNSGHLFKNQEKLTQIPFPIKQETEYTLEVFPDFIFLREGEILYQLNLNSKSFEKFFDLPVFDENVSYLAYPITIKKGADIKRKWLRAKLWKRL